MKLKTLMDHMPIYQNIVLMQHMETLAEGRKDSDLIKSYGDKTVGLFRSLSDTTLEVNVYDHGKKDD